MATDMMLDDDVRRRVRELRAAGRSTEGVACVAVARRHRPQQVSVCGYLVDVYCLEPAAGHLGPWQETSAITFGRHGVPFYVSGPFDNPARVVRTLTRSVGEGNFHFIAQVKGEAQHRLG